MEAYEMSIIVALSASLIGLHTGILLDLTPSGFTGLILLLYYLVAVLAVRKH
jgi:zinc/manganese transport system permease protein